jgi:hypothetical protein
LKYTFSKEVKIRKSIFGPRKIPGYLIYKLFDAGKLIGDFEYQDALYTISFLNREFLIEVKEQFFKKPSYKIYNKLTNELIGEFKLSTWKFNTFRFYKPHIGQKEYFIFQKIRTGIPYSIFKKGTWGHYKFELSNGTEAAVYSLKVDKTQFSWYLQNRRLTGEVELFGNNLLLVFAGFFLIERHFKNEDYRS